MHSVSDLSVVKAINCKIDGPHTVFKIRVQKTDDPTKEFFVNRRFKEFEDLKNELSKAFKNIDDAPFPKKSKFGVSRDEKSQNKRRETLDAFLKACLATKDAIKNPFFLKFLQLSDSKPVLRVSLAEGRDLFEYAQEDVLQPFWQIALCTDKEFTKASPHTIVTDTLDAQKRSTHTWTDEVYEMVLADSDIYGIRLNLYNAKTDAIRASVKIPLNSISVNHPTTHRFPLVPAIPGAHSVVGDVQLTLEVQNASAPKSILPGVEITDGVKNVKLLQQKHRELLKEERKDAPGGSLHVKLSYTPPVGSWDGPLLVRIIEARELVGSTFAPYVTVSWLNESKSTLVNAGQNSLFNQTFQFLLKKEDILSSVGMLRFGVWNMLEGKSNLLAMADFALEDVLPVLDSPNQPVEKDMWLPLAYPAAPVVDLLTQSKYAKLMQEQGYRPKYPIVLIPGLASSALEVLEGKKDWVGSRVWISINKLTKTRVNLMWKKFTDNINSIGDSVKNMFTKQDREDGIDKAQVNNWIEHMALAEDCKSDPPGVKVRNVSGTAGITYLEADSMIGKKYTYVCGPLVKNLVEFGYVENETLFAFPYDWRIPFAYLEARDGFFTTLKKNIEEIVAKQRLPVVIFGHSMGCRITHYFLNWVRNSAGQKWVDDHVHTFVAVGAPWLGAPKILRGTISGELMGMDPFLNNKQAIRLSRSFGSSPSLYPIDPQLFFQDPAKKFIYLREEKGTNNPNAAFITEKGGYNTVEQMQMLNMAGAVNQAKLLAEYLNDPAFGENKTLGVKHMMLEPPPVKNLVSVYGVDLETQLMYFYVYNAKKKRYDLANYNGVMADIGIKIKDGVGYETPETIQKCNQSLTGYTTMRSGDGTVPYASLSYCYHWRNKIENLKVIELNQAQHRDIVSTIKFFEIFIDVVAEKPIQDLKSSSKISLSNLSGMFGQLAFGNNAQLNVSDTLKKSNASAASLDTENPTNMSVSVDMPASDF